MQPQRPTSAEIVPMHGVVYAARQEVGSVLHTHSPHATAFAVASRPLPVAYEPLVRFGFTDGVPVAAYGPRGSQASIDNIQRVLNGGGQLRGLLLENHGVLATGATAEKAYEVALMVEYCARIHYQASSIGEPSLLDDAEIATLQSRFTDYGQQT